MVIDAEEPEPQRIFPTRNVVAPETRPGADAEADEVRPANLVRGFEVEKDRFVVVEDEEIRSLAPETSREMEVMEFVRLDEVDPIYFETSYYVKPDEAGARPYALLVEAMRQAEYVGVAELAMHGRRHVVILRPGAKGMVAHTMFYLDEVRREQEFQADTAGLNPKELDLAKRLIGTMAVSFDPAKYRDEYREKLRELIESKAPSRGSTPTPKKPVEAAVDILAALRKSLAQRKKAS